MAEQIEPIDDIIIVKTGTNTMFRRELGWERLNHAALNRIGRQILSLNKQGYAVPVVSSGAVTAGMEATYTPARPSGEESMPEVQRLATIGWHHVLSAWESALPDKAVGGLLVTRRELNPDMPEHDEVLRTTYTLLSHGDVPILNENDGVTHAELSRGSFGQNDTLSAIIAAQMAGSSLFGDNVRLVLLSDVDGVYEKQNDPSSIIREIDNIDDYEHLAGGSNNGNGVGGMKTKFEAARIATAAGVQVWIANGSAEYAIQRALDGQIGTHFIA